MRERKIEKFYDHQLDKEDERSIENLKYLDNSHWEVMADDQGPFNAKRYSK